MLVIHQSYYYSSKIVKIQHYIHRLCHFHYRIHCGNLNPKNCIFTSDFIFQAFSCFINILMLSVFKDASHKKNWYIRASVVDPCWNILVLFIYFLGLCPFYIAKESWENYLCISDIDLLFQSVFKNFENTIKTIRKSTFNNLFFIAWYNSNRQLINGFLTNIIFQTFQYAVLFDLL